MLRASVLFFLIAPSLFLHTHTSEQKLAHLSIQHNIRTQILLPCNGAELKEQLKKKLPHLPLHTCKILVRQIHDVPPRKSPTGRKAFTYPVKDDTTIIEGDKIILQSKL